MDVTLPKIIKPEFIPKRIGPLRKKKDLRINPNTSFLPINRSNSFTNTTSKIDEVLRSSNINKLLRSSKEKKFWSRNKAWPKTSANSAFKAVVLPSENNKNISEKLEIISL